VTCQYALLAASAVIAASLLGGCSNNAITAAGADASTPAATPTTKPASAPAMAKPAAASPPASNGAVEEQLASTALDDAKLSGVRGGFDTSSGVTLNFAFQQATFVNHNLTENIVLPTLTIAPGQGNASAAGITGGSQSSVGPGSLLGLNVAGAPSTIQGTNINTATVVANGTVQTQVSVSTAALQALVNSGLATVIQPGGSNNGGVASTITNTTNNALIQQMTTVDIGVNGLSKMLQQSVTSSVLNRLSGANAFR
jgi:hypothetical protein